MKKKRFFCYRSHMGNMWHVIAKVLPPHIVQVVKEFWFIYAVDYFIDLPEFKLFRASWQGVEITIQHTAGVMWSVKILY